MDFAIVASIAITVALVAYCRRFCCQVKQFQIGLIGHFELLPLKAGLERS
jgi:hypothetical protein